MARLLKRGQQPLPQDLLLAIGAYAATLDALMALESRRPLAARPGGGRGLVVRAMTGVIYHKETGANHKFEEEVWETCQMIRLDKGSDVWEGGVCCSLLLPEAAGTPTATAAAAAAAPPLPPLIRVPLLSHRGAYSVRKGTGKSEAWPLHRSGPRQRIGHSFSLAGHCPLVSRWPHSRHYAA